MKNVKIAVAGTGYVGLSIATLLSQHHKVVAVDVIKEKIDLINKRISPIQDEYIEKYLNEKNLDLTATLDGKMAYKDADFVIIATPTNYNYSIWSFLRFYITKRSYDIYHIHTASYGSTFRKGWYVNAAKKWKKKVILHVHGAEYMEFYNKSNNKKKICSILNSADKVIALSDEWKYKFDKIFGLNKGFKFMLL